MPGQTPAWYCPESPSVSNPIVGCFLRWPGCGAVLLGRFVDEEGLVIVFTLSQPSSSKEYYKLVAINGEIVWIRIPTISLSLLWKLLK